MRFASLCCGDFHHRSIQSLFSFYGVEHVGRLYLPFICLSVSIAANIFRKWYKLSHYLQTYRRLSALSLLLLLLLLFSLGSLALSGAFTAHHFVSWLRRNSFFQKSMDIVLISHIFAPHCAIDFAAALTTPHLLVVPWHQRTYQLTHRLPIHTHNDIFLLHLSHRSFSPLACCCGRRQAPGSPRKAR